MALDSIIIAQVNANTQAINKLNQDARKTSEFAPMPVLDTNSLIRVELGGNSYQAKASQFLPANAEFLEYIFNKQNDLSPDGTGIKYPSVDAVNDGLQLQKEYTDLLVADLVKTDKINFKDQYQTGILRVELDTSVLSVSPANTLNITNCNGLLFVNEIAPDTPSNMVGDYLKSFGNKSFVANGTNTPLAVGTRGIFYVGLDKLGNQVYRTSKVYDLDTAYLARIVVENNAGVYTIVLNRYIPDLANNRINNHDRFVISSGYIVPSGASSISFGNRGMSFYRNSINYAVNKFDPNYLQIADSVNPTPMQFLFYLPNITSLAVSLATSTVINPTQWYTSAGAVGGTAVAGANYQVYKVYLSITGTIVIQTKASTSNAPASGVNAIFANRDDALAGLNSVVFPPLTPAGDYIALGTFLLRAGTAVNGSQLNDPNDFYFQPFTSTASTSSVGVTEHDLLSGKNNNPAFQHVTSGEKTDWNTAFADRYKWDGSASGLDALLGRTSLGGTTIGQNLFTSPNPSAVRFLRANADNSISWLDANTFRTAIGAGTGNGTGNGSVTSVDMNVPTGLTVSGNPITGAGTLLLAYQSGYSIPTDAKQANWDTAFGWGNHAGAGYAFANGSNATGTWGINITGNAGSATNWGNRTANFDSLTTDILRLMVIDNATGVARQADKSVVQTYLGLDNGFIKNQNAGAQSADMWITGLIKTNNQLNAESFYNTSGYLFSNTDFKFMLGDGSWYQNISALSATFFGGGGVNALDYRTKGVGYISYDGDNAGTGTLTIRNSTAGTVLYFNTNGNISVGSTNNQYKFDVNGTFRSVNDSLIAGRLTSNTRQVTGVASGTQWVKLCTISDQASIKIAYVVGSNTSEEAGTISIVTMYDAGATSINVEKNTYNSKLVEIRVVSVGQGVTKDVYVRLVDGDGYAPTIYWNIIDGDANTVIHNVATGTPVEGLYTQLLLIANEANFFNKPLIITNNGAKIRLNTNTESDSYWTEILNTYNTNSFKLVNRTAGLTLELLGRYNDNLVLMAGGGKVGIGISPTAYLDIVSGSQSNNALNFRYSTGYGNTGLSCIFDSGSDAGNILSFNINNASGSAIQRMYISGNGNVTIPALGNGSNTRIVTADASGKLSTGGSASNIPKRFVCQLLQSGGSAPAYLAILVDQLSSTPTLSYNGVGQYRLTSPDFSNGSKMNIQINQGISVVEGSVRARKGSGNTIELNTYNTTPLLANDVISIQYCTLDIEVYP